MFKVPILRDVKISSCKNRAKLHKNAQLHENAVFLQITSKVTTGSVLAHGKQYCSRHGDRGWIAALWRGNQIYGAFFCPTTTEPIPVISHKMSPRRRQDVVFGWRTLSYRGKDARFLHKNQCWTEILIPSHDKMAAVDSFDTKKFFFLFQIGWRGEGPRYHALRENTAPGGRRGRCGTAQRATPATHRSQSIHLYTSTFTAQLCMKSNRKHTYFNVGC